MKWDNKEEAIEEEVLDQEEIADVIQITSEEIEETLIDLDSEKDLEISKDQTETKGIAEEEEEEEIKEGEEELEETEMAEETKEEEKEETIKKSKQVIWIQNSEIIGSSMERKMVKVFIFLFRWQKFGKSKNEWIDGWLLEEKGLKKIIKERMKGRFA